jgi:predicted  nucleic acid-binding Zn-ribbon protein
MSKLIDDLFRLQSLVRSAQPASPEQREQIERLRAEIPEPIAAHFFRQIATGQKGIAYVNHGVCSACHLRLSHGLVYMLGRTNELMVCESCGAFIAPAPAAVTPPVPLPRVRRVVAGRARVNAAA